MSIINKVAGWLANISTYDATTGAISDITLPGNVTGSALKASGNGIVIAGNNITSTGTPILIDPLNDGSPAGNVIIKGSMEVTGNLTYNDISTAVTSNLVWVAADDANTALTASGGGLAVGPNAAPYATWLYNSTSNSWVSNINVTAAAFYGDGGHLSNISANAISGGTYGNANLANIGSNAIGTTGNVSAGYFIGNGSALTGLPAGYGNANLANIGANAISTTGNVSGAYFLGNGALLTGINATGSGNSISNGTSNVSIPAANANIEFAVAGNSVGNLTANSTSLIIRNDANANLNAVYFNSTTKELTYTGPAPYTVRNINLTNGLSNSVANIISAAGFADGAGATYIVTNSSNSTISLTGAFQGSNAFIATTSANTVSLMPTNFVELVTVTANTLHQIVYTPSQQGASTNVFRIWPNAGNGPASDTAIAWPNVDFDPMGFWNTTTNRYQPTVAGYYQITVQISETTQAQNITAVIWKNGTQVAIGASAEGAGGWQTAITSLTTFMNGTTDYLQFGGRTNGQPYAQVGKATFVTGGLVSAGSITAGTNAVFKVNGATSGTGQSLNTLTKILLPTVTQDPQGWYNSTTGRFTPTIAGYYRVVGRLSPSNLNNIQTAIYKNGTAIATNEDSIGSTWIGATETSTQVYMNGTTDYLELWGATGAATTLRVGTGGTWNEFSAELIGGLNVAPAELGSSQAVFKISLAVGATGPVIGTSPTKIALPTVIADPTTAYTVATGRFQPTVAGYYRLVGRLATANSSSVAAYIYINGAAAAINQTSSGNYGGSTEVSTVAYFDGNSTYAELWGDAASSTTVRSTHAGFSEFSGELIGGSTVAAPPVLAANMAVGRVANNGGQSITSGTATKVTYNITSIDPNNWWSAANNRWIPTVSGYYQVTAQIGYNVSTASTGYGQIYLQKNGTTFASTLTENTQVGDLMFVNVSDIVYMNGTTDYLEVTTWQNTGATLTTHVGDAYNYFNVSYVGGSSVAPSTPAVTTVLNGQATGVAADGTGISSSSASPTTVMTFSLPEAGTYELHSQVSYGIPQANGYQIAVALYTAAGVIVPGTQAMIAWTPTTGWRGTDDRQYLVTVNAASTYTLRAWATAGSCTIQSNATFGWTNGYYKQVGAIGLTSNVGLTPNWTSAGAITFGATSAAPALGTGVSRNNVSYRQLGPKTWEVQMVFTTTGAGATSGTGDYLFTLPNSLQFDLTNPMQVAYTAGVGTNSWTNVSYAIADSSGLANDGTLGGQTYAVPYSATQFRIVTTTFGSAVRYWGAAWYSATAAGTVTLRFSFQAA